MAATDDGLVAGGSFGSSSGTGGGATLFSRSIQGVGSTLVDSAGRTLYLADQEANGTIKCVGDCVNFCGPGSAGGNGFMDSFAGANFVWHAAAVSGTASTPGDSGGGNGYGY